MTDIDDIIEDCLFENHRLSTFRPIIQQIGPAISLTAATKALQEISIWRIFSQAAHTIRPPGPLAPASASVGSSVAGQPHGASSQGLSSSKGKRRRETNDSDNDDDGNGTNNRRGPNAKFGLPVDLSGPYFACPFFQNCPTKRHEHRACRQQTPLWRQLRRVK